MYSGRSPVHVELSYVSRRLASRPGVSRELLALGCSGPDDVGEAVTVLSVTSGSLLWEKRNSFLPVAGLALQLDPVC